MSGHDLGRHVDHGARIDLPVDAQEHLASPSSHRHRAAPPVTVEEDFLVSHDLSQWAACPGSEIAGRVDGGSARHEAPIPVRQERHEQREGEGGRGGKTASHDRARSRHEERSAEHQGGRDGHLERAVNPPRGNEHEAAQEHAHDGARGIGGVEAPNASPHAGARGRPRGDGTRKGRAHPERDHGEGGDAHEYLHEIHPAGHRGDAERGQDQIGQAIEAHENDRGRKPHAALDHAQRGGTYGAISPAPRIDRAAHGEADEHSKEHGRESIGRASQEERERARPCDLEDHGHRPRDRHGRRNQPRHSRGSLLSPGGEDRRRGERRAPARDGEGEGRGGQVGARGDPDGDPVAQGGKQEVSGGQRSRDRAPGVDGVERADATAGRFAS